MARPAHLEHSHRSGAYARQLANIDKIASSRPLNVDEAITRIELLVKTGNIASAQDSAEQLLKSRHLTDHQTYRVFDSLGACYFRSGDRPRALKQFDRAIKLAQKNTDAVSECTLRVHSFRHQVHWTSLEKPTSEVAELRRLVHHVGEPELSLQFHLGLVELAARLGLPHRARRHLETARVLADVVDNKGLKAEFALNEVTLNGFESNLSEAMRLALELIPLSEEAGSSSVHFGVFTNVAHLLVAQARFAEALDWVNRGLNDARFEGASRIAIRDTLMMLHVARGAMSEAATEAQIIENLIAEHRAQSTFFAIWHDVTLVRWRYRLGEYEKGLQIAQRAAPKAIELADRELTIRLQLLSAEGLARLNRRTEALNVFSLAVIGNDSPSPEIVAEIGRVAGMVVATDNPKLAASCFEQASSILRVVGNLTASQEVSRDALEVLPQNQSRDKAPDGSEIAQRLAWLANLGSHPLVVATQILSVLVDCGVVAKAVIESSALGKRRIVARHPENSTEFESTQPNGAITIPVGAQNGRELALVVVPKTESSAAATVLATERLARAALTISKARQDEREQIALWPDQPPEQDLGLVYVSERMGDVIQTVRRAANAPLSVLLTGESGVGKEVLARALHLASARNDKTFLPFNCSTVPKDMLDSQLFGHRKGAFTGAHEAGIGVIRAADGGTLFLDEIGEMSMDAQPKLLRFLESGEIHPLGEPRPVHVDVRIVAATNANLDQLVSEGKFREDLFYRLNVLPIHIPPLRERREEVPALVDHFLEKFGREMHKPMMRVADETLEYLLLYRWPGNVRQLANEIRRMVALAEPGAVLTPAHLSKEITSTRRTVAVEPSEFVMRLDQPLADATDQLERAAIERALTASNGNNDQAAKILGLSRKGLYLKRQRLGLK